MTTEQKIMLDEFMIQNGISEQSLSAELTARQRERIKDTLSKQTAEYKAKYCGKFFRGENDGVDIYYKVIAPCGNFMDEISCIFFGLNPMLEKFGNGEVTLTDDTAFWSGSVDTSELDKAEEISAEEFSSAIREWMSKVLKLEWSV